jgi:ABC-type dipeptide/oligopeptide/nickel transport system ATPase subunit
VIHLRRPSQAEPSENVESRDSVSDLTGRDLVLVAHDLGLVRRMCDRVAVMQVGEIVELVPARDPALGRAARNRNRRTPA